MGFSCVPKFLYSYFVLNVDVLISVATMTLPQPKKPWSPWDTSSRPRAPLQGKPMGTDSPLLDRLMNPHPLGQHHSPPLLEKPCQRRRKKEVGWWRTVLFVYNSPLVKLRWACLITSTYCSASVSPSIYPSVNMMFSTFLLNYWTLNKSCDKLL